jgi:CRISPR system Cascade subunit CasA
MFLTQLAAIALHRAGQTDPAVSEGEWKELLLALTEGKHEPWCLVVPQLHEAAFFQPPVPEGTLEGWKTHEHPDDIDILVTAKAHDVKASLVAGRDVEAWVYAVATLQTTQGVYGKGKYGVARMNRGYGSRCRVGCTADLSLASRFLRDLDVMTSSWADQIARGYNPDGVALVWTMRWDGETALGAHELAPHFIEVCRRVRVTEGDGGLAFHDTTSHGRRCLRETEGGDVGDPWIPVDRTKGTALSITNRGFDYRLLVQLLFENDYAPAAAQRVQKDDPDPLLFVASALARGQGGTDGLHERVLTLDTTLRVRLADTELRAQVAKRATERVAWAEVMQRKALYPALKLLNWAEKNTFGRRVDDAFFLHLISTLGQEDEEARVSWQRRLRELARAELEAAFSRCPFPSAHRFKAISAAERAFALGLKKHFPDIEPARAAAEGVSA